MNLSKLTIPDFVKELASDSPAPGGGSVAALAGSIGAALSVMVASLTVGKEKYKDAWDEMASVKDEGEKLAEKFIELMEDDSRAFNLFMDALQMPKSTDQEKSERSKAIQDATKKAIEVPLQTLKECLTVVRLAKAAASKGNPNAVTDAGSAAVLAKAAAVAASYNVKINLLGLKDKDFAAKVKNDMDHWLGEITAMAESVEESVEAAIN